MDKLKLKTHKGLAKRVKVSARGKVTYHHPGASHLQSGKPAKRRRRLRRVAGLDGSNLKRTLKSLST